MRATDLAASVPWAIRPEALQQLFDIAGRVNEPDFEQAARRMDERYREIQGVSSVHGKPLNGTKSIVMRGNVAVLPVEGPIFRYANLFSSMSGASSLEMLAKDLRTALNDNDVKAILLHVDSPGGEVNGTGEFADMLYQVRGQKPIWAYISNEGCSAAYWIASACDRIVCAPTSIIGSIGVVAAVPDPSKDSGNKIQFVSSQSPNKRPDPTTDEGKAQIQSMVDDLADQFVSTVARNRGVDFDDVLSKYGAGGVMVGNKAVTAGLADAIGSFEQSILLINTAPGEPIKEDDKKASQDTDVTDAPKTPTKQSTHKKGISPMTSFRDRFQAWMNGAPDAEFDAEGGAAEASTPPVVLPPVTPALTTTELENRQLREQMTRLQDENRRIKVARIQERAEGFWSTLYAAHKVVPAEEAGVIAQYVQAATDDEVLPLSDGSTRVATVEAAYKARPSNMLMAEQVPDALNEVIALRNKMHTPTMASQTPDGHPMRDERRQELLKMTDLGKQVLDNKRSSNGRSN